MMAPTGQMREGGPEYKIRMVQTETGLSGQIKEEDHHMAGAQKVETEKKITMRKEHRTLDEGEEAAITKTLLVMGMRTEEVHQAVNGVTLDMRTVDPPAAKDLMTDVVEHMIPGVLREVMIADMQVVKGTGAIRVDMMIEHTVKVTILKLITQETTGEEERRIIEAVTPRAPPGDTKVVRTGNVETTEDKDKMTQAEMKHMREVTVVLQDTGPAWKLEHPPGTLTLPQGREAGVDGMHGRMTTMRDITVELLLQTNTLPIWSLMAH